jgi:hypothetical protein
MKPLIEIPDLIMLMQRGFYHERIRFGMPLGDLRSCLPDPDAIMGNDNVGYLFYGFLRIGHLNGLVNEIAIFFTKDPHVKFPTNFKNIDDEIDFIETGTKLHEIIKCFNLHGIGWNGQFRKNELDYVTINVKEGSAVTFQLDSGEIYRIAFNPQA